MRARWQNLRYHVGPPENTTPLNAARTVRQATWPRVSACFLLLGLLLYMPALLAWFSSDDFLHLGRVIEGGLPFVPDGQTGGFLRPLVGLSFWLEYHLWGLSPFGFHLVNVLLHIANSLLVVKLTMLLMPHAARHRTFTSISAGLVFLTLACHAEPVAWISGRTDVLATFFMLAALCSFCRGLRGDGWTWPAISLLAFAAALLSKESALALPLLLLLCGLYLRSAGAIRQTPDRLAAWGAACLVLLGVYILYRRWMLGVFIGGYGAQGHLRFYKDLLAQAMSRFTWRVYLPPLPRATADWIAPHAGWLGNLFLVLLLAATVALCMRARKRRTYGVGMFLFCAFWAALLPAINLRIQWTNAEGERFLYLASVFAAMAMAHLLVRTRRRWSRFTLLALVLCAQSACLIAANLHWHTAGAIAASIINDIQAEHAGGEIVLANKPDAYRGALVLRTGLGEGLCYFGRMPLGPVSVQVLYAAGLYHRDRSFSLEEQGAPGDVYWLKSDDPECQLDEEDRGELIDTLEDGGDSRTFRLLAPLPDMEIYYYNPPGVTLLHRLNDVQQPNRTSTAS